MMDFTNMSYLTIGAVQLNKQVYWDGRRSGYYSWSYSGNREAVQQEKEFLIVSKR